MELVNGVPTLNVTYSDNSGSGINAGAEKTVSEGTWYHIAGYWRKSDGMGVYRNGAGSKGEGLPDLFLRDNEGSLPSIGCQAKNSFFFNGSVDEVRVYSRALSKGEIVALAQK